MRRISGSFDVGRSQELGVPPLFLLCSLCVFAVKNLTAKIQGVIMVSMSSTERLLAGAKELGFELCGIAGVAGTDSSVPFAAFERWLRAGMHAGMAHFVRNFEARKHPASLLPGVQSLLMLGVSYGTVLNSQPHPVRQLSGIAEYARGIDYHHWIRSRLAVLAELHHELFPESRSRGVVDTAPIFEKHYAAAAGLGTVGKNTLLIHPQLGSKFFLGALLSTEQLSAEPTGSIPPPKPFNPCRGCRRCLDACPTGALCAPFVLDARRCLSYWTLEHRGELPKEIADKRGSRFLGCDTCQSICPHHSSIPIIPEGTLDPFLLDTQTLQDFLIGTALERTVFGFDRKGGGG